jgi:F0F1-type ATP synthase assembly protein I
MLGNTTLVENQIEIFIEGCLKSSEYYISITVRMNPIAITPGTIAPPTAVAEDAILEAVPIADNASSDNIHNDENVSEDEEAEEQETEPENASTANTAESDNIECSCCWSNIVLIAEYIRALIIGTGLGIFIHIWFMNVAAGVCIGIMTGAIYAIYSFCQYYITRAKLRNEAEAEMMRHMYSFYRNPTVDEYQQILKLMPLIGNQLRYANWVAAVLNNYPQLFQGRYIENEVCEQGIKVAAAAYFDTTATMPDPINVGHFVQCAVARYGATGKRDHRIQDWRTREDFTFSQRSQFAILDLIFDEIDRSIPIVEKPIQPIAEVIPIPEVTEVQPIEEKVTEPVIETPVVQPTTAEGFSFSSYFSRS